MRIILPKSCNLQLLIILFSIASASGQTTSQTFNSSTTFTVPLGVTSIVTEVWAGGGKGGTRVAGSSGYGGGGGGAYSRSTIAVIPGNTYAVNVGTGSSTTASGGDSWFINASTVLAKGGNSVPNDSSIGALGGQASAGIGAIKFSGGNGANGIAATYGGGGGSSAGTSNNGTNATNNNGATAPIGGGNGGNGKLNPSGNGSPGIIPGGGGGGAFRTTGNAIGGNGANGRVILTYAIPEIDITGNGISILDEDITPTLLDNTNFGTTNFGSPILKTFTILNTSTTCNLHLGAFTISGVDASDFTIVTPPNPIVTTGSFTTFTISFNPNGGGIRNATFSIQNNDTNENPYNFSIQGNGNGPEINTTGNLISIIDGNVTPSLLDWTDFSNITTTRTFTINNTGTTNLAITSINITGIDASNFSIISFPDFTILPGQNSNLVIGFTPTTIGIKNATVTINNNDFNENIFDFAIRGLGTLPQMNVRGNNLIIADGDITPTFLDWTDLASTNIGSPITRVYTIENTGTINLNLTGFPQVSISGTGYAITTQPASTVNGLSSTTFIVTFNPLSLGISNGDITITNNDVGINKNPYNYRITCEGIQAFIDTDGDGIIDNVDFDDDNDGIPDSIEQNYASNSVLGTTIQKTLLNETFGVGTTRARINSNVPTASTTYCYEDGTIAMAIDECDTNSSLNDGQYTVNHIAGTTAVASWAPSYWYQGPDHTVDTNGRMALFNATNDITDEFYRTIVQGITANAPLTYSFWVLNLDRTDAPGIATRNRPNLTVEFRDLSNNLISSISTGDIAPTTAGNLAGDWYQFSASFTPVTTGFSIVFKNNQPGGAGNDLALDDIVITQILTDTDQDGTPDVYDLDSDNDGIGGIVEDGRANLSNGKDSMDLSGGTWIDTNNNGWHDEAESYYASNLPLNFDNDFVPNYIDLDSDNDSVFDVDEAGLFNGDGDVNCDGLGEGTDTDKDGITSMFDNTVGYGNSGKPLPNNTIGSGNPDYLKLISGLDGSTDISKTLYANLDGDSNGIIDGNIDVDRDGIIDAFDTDITVYGSPRDLNRKLYLDFDGRNDYGQGTGVLSGLANASLMAWINLNESFTNNGVVLGQDKFHIRITNSKKLEVILNGITLTHNTISLNTKQWYHVGAVFGGGNLKLYLNGHLVESISCGGSINSDASLLTIGKNPTSNSMFFYGKIDEVRVFNVALTNLQFQRMVYQEIDNNSSQVRGIIIPKNVGSLPFANLLRYFRMDVYKNDIIDDLSTPTIDLGTGMKIFNNKVIKPQQAPLPFVTLRDGNFTTAVDNTTNEVLGLDIMSQDWSIVEVKHNIKETSNTIDLGMILLSGAKVEMQNDTKIQNDWYLKLDGSIILHEKSQLVQSIESDLEPTSSGYISRTQTGTSNIYNYNYWSSPVSTINNSNNNTSYTISSIFKDGTTSIPQNINWVGGYNGSPSSPISISSSWLYKFQNLSNSYSNWQYVGPTGSLNPAEGFTMKGSGTTEANQNYYFIGKPNNGAISYNINANNLVLAGNPYASALDATNFINDNLTTTTGTLLFWEHYSTNNTHVLQQYQGGYALRNLVGGVPPIAPAGISGLGSSSKTPGRYVPVGQGFFMMGSITGGTINFNNGQRNFVKEDHLDSNTMFRNASLVEITNSNDNDDTSDDNFKRVRLGFTSKDNYHRQILLGFMRNNASSDIEAGYDAIMIEDQPSDMYFVNNTTSLIIQGEGHFNKNNSYPISIKIHEAGTISINLDGLENFNNNQNVFIYDITTNTYHNLIINPLTLALNNGVYNDRFWLCFKRNANINTNFKTNEEFDTTEEFDYVVISKNKNIQIQNNVETEQIISVIIYNMLGQKILTQNITDEDQKNIVISNLNCSSGTYIINTITNKGEYSKKIVIN